jgi:hypothetical protein
MDPKGGFAMTLHENRTAAHVSDVEERGAAPASDRRRFLTLSAAALAVGAVPAAAHARAGDDATGAAPLDLAAFLALANPLAQALVGDTSPLGQDRYLLSIAALAVRLVDVPLPEFEPRASPGYSLGFNPGGDPFNVLHWKLEPGAAIGDHAHTYGNVVTLVLDGDVVVRNFEVVGARDYDAKGPVRVRRTCEQVLRAGGINLVSLERNYTHGFRAGPRGARGLDITTRIRDRGPTPLLELGAAAAGAEHGVFDATWKKGD